jgi:hypothetical protein
MLEVLKKIDGDIMDISRTWKNIGENMKASETETLGYYELKECKSWLGEKC